MSVRELEEKVKRLDNLEECKTPKSKKDYNTVWLDEIEEKFKNFFQTKVQVKHSISNKGKIIVEYYSNEELDRILDIINRG